jgi:hypothetical protein
VGYWVVELEKRGESCGETWSTRIGESRLLNSLMMVVERSGLVECSIKWYSIRLVLMEAIQPFSAPGRCERVDRLIRSLLAVLFFGLWLK